MNLTIARHAGASTTTTLEFAGGLSQPVPVPGTGITLRVRDDAPEATAWILRAAGIPEADLGDVVHKIEAAGADVLISLFGEAPAEPYLTWKNLWYSDRPLPYRLGAVLLAVAERTHEIRQAGGH